MRRGRRDIPKWPDSAAPKPAPTYSVGQAVGALVLIRREPGGACEVWVCRCECGALCTRSAQQIATRATCGEHRAGRSPSRDQPEFKVWRSMHARCSGTHDPIYGGRGIRVCERWVSFDAFLEDMGRRPSDRHSIERLRVNDGYQPDNCVWATSKVQNRNRRNVPLLTAHGRTQCRSAWAEESGISLATLVNRLRRMSLEEALAIGTGRAPNRVAA